MIRCNNCGQKFEGVEAYHRHRWVTHAGELDKGEVYR